MRGFRVDARNISYEEKDALITATLAADPETVRFLLSRGADPNFNPCPEDEPDRISQALDYASIDAWLERDPPEGEAYAKIEAMLKAAGAVHCRPTPGEAETQP